MFELTHVQPVKIFCFIVEHIQIFSMQILQSYQSCKIYYTPYNSITHVEIYKLPRDFDKWTYAILLKRYQIPIPPALIYCVW